ncbi:MAG: hypothetical protein K9N06_02555 [Candidatus Cloacimonetes bacterium]|nr:hypothetical protein [Candidatus Cloacimonadota bacterium]
MKILLIGVLFLLLTFSLSADAPWACVGCLRVKINFENDEPLYGYTTLHGWDVSKMSAIGVDSRKIYKLLPGTDILPYFSDEVHRRKFAEEIFYIPDMLGVVPADKITPLDSLQNITSIEYIDWLDYRACEYSGFIVMSVKDIERLRNCGSMQKFIIDDEDVMAVKHYILIDHPLSNETNRMLIDYNYLEIIKNDLMKRPPNEDELLEFYRKLIYMTDTQMYVNEFKVYHALEYFQYIRHHIDVDILSTETDKDFQFKENKLRELFNQVIEDNNIIVISIGWD